jgi:DNA-binding MarR family transcriptional regulator
MGRFRDQPEFGDGPRVPLDREQQARFRAKLKFKCFRQVKRLTITGVAVAEIMLDMQGKDGRLDPSIKTLAARAGVDPSTVVRALHRLRECGFVTWVQRLVRRGNRVERTSNAYVLIMPETPNLHFKQRVFSHLKPTSSRLPSRPREDERARENAARQLDAMGHFNLAAKMRA